jgi:hypothetical protein
MINIHRIIISGCRLQVEDRVLLESFRDVLKMRMKASSVLFNLDECDNVNGSSDEQKGENHE